MHTNMIQIYAKLSSPVRTHTNYKNGNVGNQRTGVARLLSGKTDCESAVKVAKVQAAVSQHNTL